ncbi:MAG: cupin domain-containing protein [Williamsia sp.]|nr:cupin domain-containing protein [Williamsia sp.]
MHPYPAAYWIDRLQLTSHVEGGAFSEYYRSSLLLDIPDGTRRHSSTGIYFLLQKGQFSAFHRIASDELWHFYYGDPLEVFELDQDGSLRIHRLGNQPQLDQQFHCVIKAGNWFASAPAAGSEYSLCGCTVSPGFEYADFELAERSILLNEFPQHSQLIRSLTR